MNSHDIKDCAPARVFSDDLRTGTSPHDQEKLPYVIEPTRRGEFLIRARMNNYWMDFECVRCLAWITPECVGWSRAKIPVYEQKDERPQRFGSLPPTEDPENAFVTMYGYLKWDGCMEVYREEVHTCSAEDLEDEYRCLRRLHQLAAEQMGHWEGDVPRDLVAPESDA